MIRSRTYLGELRSGRHVNPAAHEPIVDLALWTAAQHPNPRKAPGAQERRLPAVGPDPLRRVRLLPPRDPERERRVYRCTVRHAGGDVPAPGSGRVRTAPTRRPRKRSGAS